MDVHERPSSSLANISRSPSKRSRSESYTSQDWTIEDGMTKNVERSRMKGRFTLYDGTVLEGVSFGARVSCAAEVVFSTGMVGYPEALTDPSYRGQILVLTYPSIGNYGVPPDDRDHMDLLEHFESNDIHITGLIVSDYSYDYSHWASVRSLSTWLSDRNIPALYGVDTRALTMKLRDTGVMLGKVEFGDSVVEFNDPNLRNLVAEVSCKEVRHFGTATGVKIVAVDCGMKNNIIRKLVSYDINLTVVPWDYDFNQLEWDGLFISNGPGNPSMATKTVEHVRQALTLDKPIFGICLGNQILALACGARTYKMKFGNRMPDAIMALRNASYLLRPKHATSPVDAISTPNTGSAP